MLDLKGFILFKMQWPCGKNDNVQECLHNDRMPFFIEEKNKEFYLRGMKE